MHHKSWNCSECMTLKYIDIEYGMMFLTDTRGDLIISLQKDTNGHIKPTNGEHCHSADCKHSQQNLATARLTPSPVLLWR